MILREMWWICNSIIYFVLIVKYMKTKKKLSVSFYQNLTTYITYIVIITIKTGKSFKYLIINNKIKNNIRLFVQNIMNKTNFVGTELTKTKRLILFLNKLMIVTNHAVRCHKEKSNMYFLRPPKTLINSDSCFTTVI